MITGNISDIATYRSINDGLDKAIDFVSKISPSIYPGKYEIDGSDVYAIVTEFTTEGCDQIRYEAHRKYIDLQYIIGGQEDIAYTSIYDAESITQYDEAHDISFFRGSGNLLYIHSGHFYIMFPFDAHACALGKKCYLKKVIVKIKMDTVTF